MSGICGWFRADEGRAAGPQVIAAMAAPLARFDRNPARSASAGFGAVAASGRDADVFQTGERLVAVWGKPRFARPELAALAERDGVAHALARGYDRDGAGALAWTSGAYAVAVLNRGGEAMLAVDRMGTQPICYCLVDGCLVFGSTLDAISAFPGSATEINPQAIYDYVHFHMVPGPETIYAGRHRLLPGWRLAWRGGEPEVRP